MREEEKVLLAKFMGKNEKKYYFAGKKQIQSYTPAFSHQKFATEVTVEMWYMQVVVTIEEEEGVSPPRVSPPRYLHQAVRISAVFEKGSNKQKKLCFQFLSTQN